MAEVTRSRPHGRGPSAGRALVPQARPGDEDARRWPGDETAGPRPGDESAGPQPGDETAGTGGTGAADPGESEPDARFTFANERTFLAWNRTALALIVAGLAIVQLLPPFAGVPVGRHLIAIPLIAVGGLLSVTSYLEWRRAQRALRRGEPLPKSVLPRVLAGSITLLALLAAGLVLASAALR